jgi:hypothetical protein
LSIDDVLSGKAQFAVVCGDATAVMATLPDGCVAVTYTDPPYGLSQQSTNDVIQCLTTWLAGDVYTHGSVRKGKQNCTANIIRDAAVRDSDDPQADAGQHRIPLDIVSSMGRDEVLGTVDLNDYIQLRKEKVDGENTVVDLNDLLVNMDDTKPQEAFTHGHFALWPVEGFTGCVGVCSCASQTQDSTLRVDVWFSDSAPSKPKSATGVVALTGTERRAVLTLDVARGTATLAPAEGACDDFRRLQLGRTEVVGALSGASSLSSELQPALVGGVRHAADGALPLNGVVDTPRDAAADSGAVVDVGLGRVEGATARCTLLLHGDVISRLTSPIKSKGGMMGHSWDAFVPGPEAWREVHRCLRPGGYCVAFSSTRTVDLLGIAVRLAGFEMREGLAWIGSQGFPKSLDVSKAIDTTDAVGSARPEDVRRLRMGDDYEPTGRPRSGEAMGGGVLGPATAKAAPSSPAAIQWDGYGTTTKPAFEPIVVARKALDGTVAENVQRHGCGALNIDAARIGTTDTYSYPNGPGGKSMHYSSDKRSSEVRPNATQNHSAGRFPASLALVHDEGCVCEGTRRVRGDARQGGGTRPANFGDVGSASGDGRPCAPGHADPDGMETVDAWHCTPTCAVAELGRQSGELTSGQPSGVQNVQSATYGQSRPGRDVTGFGDTGTAARFFYQAKASASDRLAYITCTAGCARHESVAFQKDARDSARDPSREQPHGFCRACNGVRTHYGHPTVKPLALAAYHARLLSLPPHTRPIALVPFCGTGIEARALLDVGFRVIAIDLDPRHCAMTTFRLTHKEPEHVTEERAAVTEAERGDWTKPIRVSEVAVKAPVPSVRKEQLPLFGAK